jgi:hypothetical protein
LVSRKSEKFLREKETRPGDGIQNRVLLELLDIVVRKVELEVELSADTGRRAYRLRIGTKIHILLGRP